MKRFCQFGSIVLALVFVFGTARLVEGADTTGAVTIQSTSIAAGVGVQWGEGKLTYKGKTYLFSLQGLDLVGLGYAQVTATGTVSNLTQLSDFAGVYAAAEAGAVAGSSGPGTITMKNPHGVVMILHALQEGAQLKLAAGGVNIELKG